VRHDVAPPHPSSQQGFIQFAILRLSNGLTAQPAASQESAGGQAEPQKQDHRKLQNEEYRENEKAIFQTSGY